MDYLQCQRVFEQRLVVLLQELHVAVPAHYDVMVQHV